MELWFKRPQLQGLGLIKVEIRLFLDLWKLGRFNEPLFVPGLFGSVLFRSHLTDSHDDKDNQEHEIQVIGLGEGTGGFEIVP